MIVDLHDLDDGVEIAADLCVVGSGPAGIAVARRFLDGPLGVVMLESGGLEREPESRELNAGEVRGETYVDLREPRIRALGGTTGHWSGELGRLGDASFADRPWLGLPGWPIARAEIDSRYDAALDLCGGAPWPEGRMREPAGLDREPPPPGGAPWLELRYRQSRPRAPRRFGRHFRAELAAARSLRVLLHSTVTELRTDEPGGRVLAAEVRGYDGRRATIRARAFVLACGGLENARLLLLSNRRAPDGLGNRHGMVGRCFAEHPVVELGEVVGDAARLGALAGLDEDGLRLLRDLAPTAAHASERRSLEFGVETFLEGVRGGAGRATRPDDPVSAAVEGVSDWIGGAARTARGRCEVMMEMAPDPRNRVGLGEATDRHGCRRLVLDFAFGESQRRTVGAALDGLIRELGRLSIGRVRPTVAAEWLERGRGRWRGAMHHLGTTRMADDPRHGVVDRDARVHGVENLWIAGSSIFPVGDYVNPTLTIVALALRLGEHVEGRLS